VNFRKKINYERIVWSQFAACLLLFVYLASGAIFDVQTAKRSNLIFCPLMKVWVTEGNFAASKAKNEPLKDLCAAADSKQTFFDKSFQKLLFTNIKFDSAGFEALFFDYAKSGSEAFAAAGSNSHDAPETQIVKSVVVEKSLAGSQKDFGKKRAENFVLNLLARPSGASSSTSFDLAQIYKLDKISRRIQPRAPPSTL
jgi:hypothetical protein